MPADDGTLHPHELPTLHGHSTGDPTPVGIPRSEEVQRIGAYQLIRRIGRGAMGQVYEALDTRLGRTVAVKILTNERTIGREGIARFQREALSAAKLRHPNIVRLLDVGQEGDRYYLVMELVTGVTLGRALRERRLSYRARAIALEQVARAVQHAHENGIIHRDLKPANIMVERRRGNSVDSTSRFSYGSDTGSTSPDDSRSHLSSDHALGTPQVMDFGLALDASEDSRLSLDGKAIGTPSYMPPEQAAGERDRVGPRSDVYSLGAILYEMITGRPPFLGEQILQVLQAVVDDDPIRPSQLAPDVPRDLETICLTCLDKDPDRRYQSAAALADDLTAWLSGDPISARSTGPVGRLIKRIRKHPVTTLIVVSCILALVVGSSIYVHLIKERAKEAEFARDNARESLRKLQAETAARLRAEHASSVLLSERERSWSLVFHDDFSRADVEDRWDILGATSWSVVNGWLRVEGGEPQLAVVKQGYGGDLRIDFDCRLSGDYLNDVSGFIASRSEDFIEKRAPSGYEFKYGGYGNSRNVLRRSGEILWQRMDHPLTTDRIYHVRIEKDDALLRMIVDDEIVFSVRDDDPLSAFERNRIGLFGWRAITEWDNVRVWQRGEPKAADLLDVTDRAMSNRRFAAAEELYAEIARSSHDPKRRALAEAGRAKAAFLREQVALLPATRERIRTYWPDASVEFANEGLAVRIGPEGQTDLGPLAGELVTDLEITGLPIDDLTPLAKLTLTRLVCPRALIQDVSPLAKQTELEDLDLDGNPITDLTPLRNLSLRSLHLNGTTINSIADLAAIPLEYLDISHTQVRDLTPLRGMPLQELAIANLEQTDIEALRGLPLRHLICRDNALTSLEPLSGMRLRGLRAERNHINDLEPLRSMELDQLLLGNNRISDLEPIGGQSLVVLQVNNNQIRNLEPLRGMAITSFLCEDNLIEDISPITGMPLDSLFIDHNPVTELSPIFATLPRTCSFSHQLPKPMLEQIVELAPPASQPATLARQWLAWQANDPVAFRQACQLEGQPRYGFVPGLLKLEEAQTLAAFAGAHLVDVETTGERLHLSQLKLLARYLPIWLGATATATEARWSNGTPARRSDFYPPDTAGPTYAGDTLFRWWTVVRSDLLPQTHAALVLEWDD